MSSAADISNRHMLPANGLADASQSKSVSVRVIIDDVWARSTSGQFLASCLVNLLCRQVELISRIEIIAAPTATLIALPGVAEPDSFPDCLSQLARWAVNDRVTVVVGATDSMVDYAVVVGAARGEYSTARHVLSALGDGWRAWLGELSRAPTTVSPRSKNPLGPFFVATVAAGEIFKRSRGILRGRYLAAAGNSLWSGLTSDNWDQLDDGPELTGLPLPPTHVVGAGAVGNGLSYVIASACFAEAYVIPIDDDHYDETNLNRCVLAGWDDQGANKVETIARMLRASNVAVFPFAGSINQYVTDPKNGLRPDIAAKANQLQFAIVVSCVDKGTSRQDVQGLWPNLLLGGSTLDLVAKTNLYRAWPGAACLACHNRAERDGEKVRALEARLRKMPADDRRQFLKERELDADAIEEYLAGTRCGGIGEAALKDFATRPDTQFSVGFVSLGAAVLLGAALFRQSIFGGCAPQRGDMTSFNYLNGNSYDAGLGYDPDCELGCQEVPC